MSSSMGWSDFRRRADVVRSAPLETVLLWRGAERDRGDRSKWRTEQGHVSITGSQFMNWGRGVGGGGAIDLVMHLANMKCGAAVLWLEQQLGIQTVGGEEHVAATPGFSNAASSTPAVSKLAQQTSSGVSSKPQRRALVLPQRDDRLLHRVLEYLTIRRYLPESLLTPLIETGKLYADQRANAVFLLTAGKAHRPVGAELRGTGQRKWHGMAAGTDKNAGYFWIGAKGAKEIVLCESAIDAISCLAIHPQTICISTAGVRSQPRWLPGLISLIRRGYDIACGFDTDVAGEAAARSMIALYSGVKRLRPPAHDWNDALRLSS